jgi:hypothetical protein
MAEQIKDGGMAFPGSALYDPSREQVNVAQAYGADPGMSLRDYFAAKALPIVAGIADLDNVGCLDVALAAYEWADAMLQARETPPCV